MEGRLQAPCDIGEADHHDAHPVSRRQHDLLGVTGIQLVQRRNDVAKIQDGVPRTVGLVEDFRFGVIDRRAGNTKYRTWWQ